MMKTIKTKLTSMWTKFKKWSVAILISIGLVAAPMLMAAPKDFSWSNPTQRMDGTPFDAATEQAEVRIYCDGDTSPTFSVAGAASTLTGEFAFGNHRCFATVVDIYGGESDPSNEVQFQSTPAKPRPPTLTAN